MSEKKKKSDVGDFAGFALLSEEKRNKARFIEDMKPECGAEAAHYAEQGHTDGRRYP